MTILQASSFPWSERVSAEVAMIPVDRRLQLWRRATIAPGGMLRVQPEGRDPILVCNVDGKIYAVDDECTHAIASLSEGRLQGNIVFCPMHGGSFDVCSGKAKSLPCKQALRTWPIEIVDGKVYLLAEELIGRKARDLYPPPRRRRWRPSICRRRTPASDVGVAAARNIPSVPRDAAVSLPADHSGATFTL